MRFGRAILLILMAALVATTACRAKPRSGTHESRSIRLVPAGRFDFESGDAAADPAFQPEELSGIAWVEGNRYLVVGDAHAAVHWMTIDVAARTGAVRSATFGSPIRLSDEGGSAIPEPAMSEDREGIAYDSERREFLIANEQTGADRRWPSIERDSINGTAVAVLRVGSDAADSSLVPFRFARPNRSFESLTRAADGTFWTANEDALSVDGPAASDSAGAVVRLLQLDRDLRPKSQVAYPLDSYEARIKTPTIVASSAISGVCDLAALPDGRLLVLERAFGGDIGGVASLRSRIYLVDRAGATDVSSTEFRVGLASRRYAPVKKTLLWQERWGLSNSNFEGMALGPELEGGGRLLVLIADNNGGSAQALFTFRIETR